MVCVPLTNNLTWARAPGNVLLSAKAADLPKDSVANASNSGRSWPRGLAQLDGSDPERLAKVCAGTERNGCLFTTTALGLVGATGAPAIF